MLDSSSSNITNGVPDPLCNNGSYSKNQQVGRCTSSSMGMNVEPGNDIDVDNTLRKVLLSINVVCAIAAFVLIFVAMTHRRTQVLYCTVQVETVVSHICTVQRETVCS